MASQGVGSRLRARFRDDSFRDALFWWSFAIYAGFCILWLILAFTNAWSNVHVGTMAGEDLTQVQRAQDLVLSFGTLGLGLFVAWLDPQTPIARPFAVGLVGTAVAFSLTAHNFLQALVPNAMTKPSLLIQVLHILFHLIAGGSYTYALLLFADGKLPRLSATTWLLVDATLVSSFLWLITHGTDPSFFILYCGIAVIVAGLFSQGHKARNSSRLVDRAQARRCRNAFAFALAFTVLLGLAESNLSVRQFLAGPLEARTSGPFSVWVLTVIPPLLSGTAVVVLLTVLWHAIVELGTGGSLAFRHRVTAVVMTLAVTITAVFHWVIDKAVEHLGTGAIFSFVGAVAAAAVAVLLLDPRLEKLLEWTGHLSTPVRNQSSLFSEFSGTGVARTEDLIPVLAYALQEFGVRHFHFEVLVPGSRPLIFDWDWPPETVVEHTPIPLHHENLPVGQLVIAKPNGIVLTGQERDRVSELAVQAGLAIRAHTDSLSVRELEERPTETISLSQDHASSEASSRTLAKDNRL